MSALAACSAQPEQQRPADSQLPVPPAQTAEPPDSTGLTNALATEPTLGVYPMIYQPACEGEVCTAVFEAHACQDLRLRDASSIHAPRSVTMKRGDTARVIQAIHLLSPGVVVLKRAYFHDTHTDESGNRAPNEDTLRFAAGDTLQLLLYGQRGDWNAVWRGKKTYVSEFWYAPVDAMQLGGMSQDSSIAVLRKWPRKEVWWRVTLRDGRVGWHRQDLDTTVVLASHHLEQRWGKQCSEQDQ